MKTKQPAVYILANKRNGTLYTGITSDLIGRVWLHKQKVVSGFSSEHCTQMLVYFELHADMNSAILREKRIKKWNRLWKLDLIEKFNPEWKELYDSITCTTCLIDTIRNEELVPGSPPARG